MNPSDIIDQIRKQIATNSVFPINLDHVVVGYGDKLKPPYVSISGWEEVPAYQTNGINFWDGKYEVHVFGIDRDEGGKLMLGVLSALNLFTISPGGMTTTIERWGLVMEPDYQSHWAALLNYSRNDVAVA
jgi:hypothetical protein